MPDYALTRRMLLGGGAAALVSASARTGKIRAAVLGIGHAHAAGKIAALASSADYELVGVWEPDNSLARGQKGFEQVHWLSLDEILKDSSIELIAVESNVKENLRYARMGIEAGKHIHLDKPPGVDLEGLKELLADAARRRLAVQMGYQWRYHACINAAIEAARKGWLGQVYMVRATINQMLSRGDRVALAAFSGGFMFELGCHMIDRVVDLLGKPLKITSILRHDAPIEDSLADNTLAILEYETAMAEIYIAAMQPHGNDYRRFEVLGTNGTFGAPILPPYRSLVDLKEPAGPYRKGSQTVEIQVPPGPPFAADFAELSRVIRHGATPSWSADRDLIAQKVLLEVCGYLKS